MAVQDTLKWGNAHSIRCGRFMLAGNSRHDKNQIKNHLVVNNNWFKKSKIASDSSTASKHEKVASSFREELFRISMEAKHEGLS